MSSEDGNFYGDLNTRKTQQRTFGEFLESTTAGSGGNTEQLYLAQAAIFNATSDNEPLGKLMRDIQIPSDLRASGRLYSINLWMASRFVRSLHMINWNHLARIEETVRQA